ncbi:RNA polymerase sigma factor [Kitasatospora sp. NPDC001547]|uniref:RNA polymerase sigma factor n=1 Tax=Kitasatospora sp. NPDC001547 TaxID=3364015 RepID=UPI0036AAAEFB|nr:sigma-70 family RNA polymerase sigma factor [Kitasatospora sp. Xyl93]
MTGADERGPDLGALVRAAQRGDALALDEVLGLLMPYVGRVCAPIALQDAPDAAQEAMIAIVRNLHQLLAPEALFGWARAIAAREAVRFATRRRPRPEAVDDRPDDRDPELATDIRDVLERLPPGHRAVLTLRHVEGLDERSVAEILDLPLGTVRSRLFRARHRFRAAWGAEPQ